MLAVLPAESFSTGLANLGDGACAWEMNAADYTLSSVDEAALLSPLRLLPGSAMPATSSCTGIIRHPASTSQTDPEVGFLIYCPEAVQGLAR